MPLGLVVFLSSECLPLSDYFRIFVDVKVLIIKRIYNLSLAL